MLTRKKGLGAFAGAFFADRLTQRSKPPVSDQALFSGRIRLTRPAVSFAGEFSGDPEHVA